MIAPSHITRLRRMARVLPSNNHPIRRDQSGSALVEMALSAALLVSMLFGVIEFGFALYTYQFVTEVSRELTRYAIVRGSSCSASSTMTNCGFTDSNTTLQTYARSAFTYPGMNMNSMTVTTTWYSAVKNANGTIASWSACASGTGCNTPGSIVKVSVSYPFVLNIPFVPQRSMTVSSDSSMVISQ
jgi:Flp pilus assembly protein TadG